MTTMGIVNLSDRPSGATPRDRPAETKPNVRPEWDGSTLSIEINELVPGQALPCRYSLRWIPMLNDVCARR